MIVSLTFALSVQCAKISCSFKIQFWPTVEV